ncbi:hypothetical protein [Methylosinus sp. PW1]|uniref:hypothetical protein n=1 Tax=Methylosinus sp. PW1 TaxID=107636 RepID=UPI0012EC3F69|nr:hypothetical protein [Methylosinus sp. PW1]
MFWLNEDVIAGSPFEKFTRLREIEKPSSRRAADAWNGPLFVIGPQSSDTLGDLIENSQNADPGAYQIVSYGATAERLGKEVAWPTNGVLRRGIASDDKLAEVVFDELDKRGVAPGDHQHVALIAESDTIYGQSVADTFERRFTKGMRNGRACCSESFVHRLGYLRGLDGATPKAESGDRMDAGVPSKDRDTAKTQIDPRALDLPYGQSQFDYLRRIAERLRRIDDGLRERGKEGIRAIGVLGSDAFDKLLVLRALKPAFPNAQFFTTDFDTIFATASELEWTRNLLVASSLGPELDGSLQGQIPPFRSGYQTAAFLATQLVVAEGKGVRNGSDSRSASEPHGMGKNGWRDRNFKLIRAKEPQPKLAALTSDRSATTAPSHIEDWFSEALIFEVARTGEILPLPRHRTDYATKRAHCDHNRLGSCDNIQPDAPRLYPSIGAPAQIGLAILLGSAGAAILVYAYIRRERFRKWGKPDQYSIDFVWLGALLSLSGLVALFWESFARAVTEDGAGERIAFFHGVSTWPSVLIACLAVIVSIRLIMRAGAELDANIDEIATRMRLPKPETLIDAADKRTKHDSGWMNFKRIFFYRLSESEVKQPKVRSDPPKPTQTLPWALWPAFGLFGVFETSNKSADDMGDDEESEKKLDGLPYEVEKAWETYVVQGRRKARLLRSGIASAILTITLFVLVTLLGAPSPPIRGDLARTASTFGLLAEVFFISMLVFIVFDATFLCLSFIWELARGCTKWPQLTVALYEKKLGKSVGEVSKPSEVGSSTPDRVLNDWIDLVFIQRRTECVNALVYYPFFVIAIVILAQSGVFAPYPAAGLVFAAEAAGLLAVFCCVWAFRRVAERARAETRNHISDVDIRAKAESGKGGLGDGKIKDWSAPQLDTLRERVERMRGGAFSPVLEQPVVRALSFPLLSIGVTNLLPLKTTFGF